MTSTDAAKETKDILGSMSKSAVDSIEKVAGPFTLKVVVKEGYTAWVDVNVDGVYVVSGSITGEEVYIYEVKEQCEVGSGNAEAIQVYCNGSEVTLENNDGMGYVAIAIEDDGEG